MQQYINRYIESIEKSEITVNLRAMQLIVSMEEMSDAIRNLLRNTSYVHIAL